MHGEGGRKRWAILTLVLTLLVGGVVGFLSYNAGVAHGLAISAPAMDIEQGARAAVHYHGHGWHPWGFGFFFGPLLFLFFWFFVARMLFWRWGGYGGRWGRGGYGYRGCGPGRFRGPGRHGRYDRYDRYDGDDDDRARHML